MEETKTVKQKLRKLIDVPTLIIIAVVFGVMVYYVGSYNKNKSITFNQDNSSYIMGAMILMLWILGVCMYLIFENRRVTKHNTVLLEQNNMLLLQIVDQNNKHHQRAETQYNELIKSDMAIAELILEGE